MGIIIKTNNFVSKTDTNNNRTIMKLNCNSWQQHLPVDADGNQIPLIADTQWRVKKSSVVSYPCSTGYLKNALANPNLQKDIFSALDELAPGCARYCNLDNGSYASVGTATGRKNISRIVKPHVCQSLGAEGNEVFGFAKDACTCGFDNNGDSDGDDDTSAAGCRFCGGQVSFKVTSCLDIEP